MTVRHTLTAGLTLCLTAGCGLSGGPNTTPDTQSFTRSINATPSRVVEATVAVFAERGITVATSDQTEGEVVSVPLNPTGQWGNMEPIQRVSCDNGQFPDPDSRLILTVKVQGEASRSVMSLDANHEGDTACVLSNAFLTDLMDAIAERATPGGS
jgi:hypothetical protein